jgi:hypothetical protein
MSTHERRPGAGYERADASVRGVAMFALALVAGITLVAFAMRGLFVELDPGAGPAGAPQHALAQPTEPPGPRLQATPSDELARFRLREGEQLSTYAWIDRQAGIVRLPIERAMDLVAERGLPVRK